MADLYKTLARCNELYCKGHDNNCVAYEGCKACWLKVKVQQHRRTRKKLKQKLVKEIHEN